MNMLLKQQSKPTCEYFYHWQVLVASLMSLMASLVTTSRMQQCFNVLIDIYHEFLLLFYCCVLLEIKLTTTTTGFKRYSSLR